MYSPIKNIKKHHVTQWFGENSAYYGSICHHGMCLDGHNGIDVATFYGDDVYAVEAGTVKSVRRDRDGFGHHIKIENLKTGNEWTYAHLQYIQCEEGEKVDAGEQIGTEGNSGTSFGTHLHLGLREIDQWGRVLNWDNGYFGAVDFADDLKACFLGKR